MLIGWISSVFGSLPFPKQQPSTDRLEEVAVVSGRFEKSRNATEFAFGDHPRWNGKCGSTLQVLQDVGKIFALTKHLCELI